MQIQNQKQNIQFTSTPIHYLDLIKMENGIEKGIVKAAFSKLDLKKDKATMEALKKASSKENLHFQLCCNNFLNPNPAKEKYYAIELVGNESLDKRILGLAECYQGKNGQLEVSLLAAKSECMKNNPQRTFKNTGVALLSAIYKIAKKTKAVEVKIPSGNDKFYSNIYDNSCTKYYLDRVLHCFYVANNQFDNFISFCNKNFSLNLQDKKSCFSIFKPSA